MSAIDTSIFEFFKVGPGPSSSHTIGPMRAGLDFRRAAAGLDPGLAARARAVRVRLRGSLGATGQGHGADRAVLVGLMGIGPESCPFNPLQRIPGANSGQSRFQAGLISLPLGPECVIFENEPTSPPHGNTLVIALLDEQGTGLFEKEYYSVGGGFIQWKGWTPPERGAPVHPYNNMAQLKQRLVEKGIRLHKLVLDNEKAVSGLGRDHVFDRLRDLVGVMDRAIEQGLAAEGVLPGPIGLKRKAPALMRHHLANPDSPDDLMTRLSAYAMAAAEENAAGSCVVTAPTCGACGVVPSVLYVMRRCLGLSEQSVLEGFLAGAVVGFLAKHNASVAGAEVGCQGEIGVASAMAAAMLAYANGYSFQAVENAAESALEHHLGMTCDPVGGYVQIPCIERNAMGAVKAYNAYLIAAAVSPSMHVVGLDQVIRAMAETGRDMSDKYKETSRGGLAVSLVEC